MCTPPPKIFREKFSFFSKFTCVPPPSPNPRYVPEPNQAQANKTIATKKLIVQEYKDRLKKNVKSLNDNFEGILSSMKMNDDSTQKANSTGRLADYYALRNEAMVRATLMVKAMDDLQMLTSDIREFLILRDFNFLSNSIEKAEEEFKGQVEEHEKDYNRFRANLSSTIAEVDKELAENSIQNKMADERENAAADKEDVIPSAEEQRKNEEKDEPQPQQGTSAGSGGSTLPNLYSKFVTSFENAIHDLIETEEEEPKPKQKLPSLDLEGVAAFIKEEQPSIVFMVGAGISTSAGIPDFRTPGTGLYDNLAGYKIPTPHSIFDIGYFKRNPEPFFVLAKELFHENVKPTPTHHFIKLVEEKGLLRRCFTQNIDALEFLAGLSEDKVVTAHGSHRSSTCLSCKRKYSYEWFIEKLRDPSIKVPRCENCTKRGNIVKPDIVFFGESLPHRFFSNSLVDLPKCELLIIMGTSLVVHPFASLVDNVPADTPRLLMNLVPVGQGSLSYNEAGNIRDVFWQGECDEGVFQLARLLGWEQEFKAMVKKSEAKSTTTKNEENIASDPSEIHQSKT